jgi:hypothetical protein
LPKVVLHHFLANPTLDSAWGSMRRVVKLALRDDSPSSLSDFKVIYSLACPIVHSFTAAITIFATTGNF